MKKWSLFLLVLLSFVSCHRRDETSGGTILQTSLFSPVREHTHGSTVVMLPDGSLLAAWFQGHGERWADDVCIMGARLRRGDTVWSAPFPMADVPGFPDINPVLFLDGRERLWLVWYTVLANQWSTSLPRYRLSSDYLGKGSPRWDWQATLFVKPGDKTERGIRPDDRFVRSVEEQTDRYGKRIVDSLGKDVPLYRMWLAWKEDLLRKARGEDYLRKGSYTDAAGHRKDTLSGYPLTRRLGWQTKNKALVMTDGRIILPLYSDALNLSLMALTDDGGAHWMFSTPLAGPGSIQPTLALRHDGTLVAYMRDNGPPPQRIMYSISRDRGMHWSPVEETALPNPGAGIDMVPLHNGHWVLAYNDTETGRHSLAVALSVDEGGSWPWKRHLEYDTTGKVSASYPAIIEGNDGMIHITYSYSRKDNTGSPLETIRYARITEEWIRKERAR